MLTHVGQVYQEVNFNHMCNMFEEAVRHKDQGAVNKIRDEAPMHAALYYASGVDITSSIAAQHTHAYRYTRMYVASWYMRMWRGRLLDRSGSSRVSLAIRIWRSVGTGPTE